MILPRFSVNQDVLKIVALLTMTIDHIAKYFPLGIFSDIGRSVGRISFPIFSFLLIEHLHKKQIFKKYIFRLAGFGMLTFLLLWPYQGLLKENTALPFNIMISFLITVLTLFVFVWMKKENAPIWIKIPVAFFNIVCFAVVSMGCQYSVPGFLFMLFLYFYFERQTYLNLFFVLLFSALINLGHEFHWVISLLTTVFLLRTYQNQNAVRLLKHWWTFYLYYPLHLWFLASLAYTLMY